MTRRLTLYRDDSTVQVVYDDVKAAFWTADNSVLVVSQFTDRATGAHRYIHWPRERFCWFKDEPEISLAPKGADLAELCVLLHGPHAFVATVNGCFCKYCGLEQEPYSGCDKNRCPAVTDGAHDFAARAEGVFCKACGERMPPPPSKDD